MRFSSFPAFRDYLYRGEPAVQSCASNFVFPTCWSTMKPLCTNSLIFGTTGLHPNAVVTGQNQEKKLKVACFLQDSDFICVGKVHLNSSTFMCKQVITTCANKLLQL